MSLESVDHGNRNVLILSFSVYVRLSILTFQYRLWYSIYFPQWCLLKDIICFFLIKFNFIIVCFLFFYKTFFTEILVAFSYKKKYFSTMHFYLLYVKTFITVVPLWKKQPSVTYFMFYVIFPTNLFSSVYIPDYNHFLVRYWFFLLYFNSVFCLCYTSLQFF